MAPPDGSTGPERELHGVATEIRSHLDDQAHDGIPTTLLHQWRTRLDRLHRRLKDEHPERWDELRTPATWLDSHLRFRSLIAHELGKVFWDEKDQVRYRDIDVERYLWGAR